MKVEAADFRRTFANRLNQRVCTKTVGRGDPTGH
jgi:hypothetical protein